MKTVWIAVICAALAGLGWGAYWVLSAPPAVVLSDAKQQRIWDVEHFTFEVEQKFGGSFKKAWKARDAADLEGRFLASATTEIPSASEGDVIDGGWWWQESVEASSGVALQRGAPDQVVARLCEWMQAFGSVSSVGFRVLSLQPRDGAAGQTPTTWSLRILLTAAGTAQDGSPLDVEAVQTVGAAFHDDKSIETGQILTDWRIDSLHWHATDRALFTEITKESGLVRFDFVDNWTIPPEKARSYWTFAAVGDYDRDDWLDIAVYSADGRSRVLRNIQGERFEDATSALGLPQQSKFDDVMIVSWFDFDNDGDLDLLLGSSLYRNDEGRKFVNVTLPSGLDFHDPALGVSLVDFDRDGLLDLYVLHDRPYEHADDQIGYLDDHVSGARNRLWRNVDGRRFEDVTERAGIDNGLRHSFAGVWFYANDDEWPDVYVVNDFSTNALYLNQGNGTFRDVAEAKGIASFANSMGASIADLDDNGTAEIYVGNMFSKMGRRIIEHVSADDYPPGVYEQIRGACSGNRLYRLTADETRYDEISEPLGVNQVGWAFAPLAADFDADGRLDLYATTGFISIDRTKPDG